MIANKSRGYYYILVFGLLGQVSAYFADWSALADDRQPTCVAIPANMSLCNNIGKSFLARLGFKYCKYSNVYFFRH